MVIFFLIKLSADRNTLDFKLLLNFGFLSSLTCKNYENVQSLQIVKSPIWNENWKANLHESRIEYNIAC